MKSFLKHFFKNTKAAIIGPLLVGIPLIFATTILWIISMYPASFLWDKIAPDLPVQATMAMNLMKNVGGWVLLVLVIGVIAWIGASATQRDPIEVQG